MKNFDLLLDLSSNEMLEIVGGDKFMKDLGDCLGSAAKSIWNFISNVDVAASETLMNCI